MLRRAQWIVAVFVYSVCAVLGVGACGRRTPELMAISGLRPSSFAENDLITLAGEGFVLGPEANIRFVGSVFRPAHEVAKIDFRVAGSAVDGENLEVVVTPHMVDELCGKVGEDGASHATFVGELEASFAPRIKGAPPIVGRARKIEFDVFRANPAVDAKPGKVISLRPKQGADATTSDLLRALGFEIDETSHTLAVTGVRDEEPAALGGLHVGDVLHRWSGVRVFSAHDLRVYPGQRIAPVEVVRPGYSSPIQLQIGVEGLSPLGAKGWNLGLLLLGVMMVAVLVSRSQLSQWLVWLAVAKPKTRRVEVRSFGVMPFLGVSAVFLVLAARRDAVPFELDLPLIGLLCSLTLAFFGVGCAYTERGFSLRALVQVWFWQLPLHLAFAVSMGALVLERGQANVWDLAALQGVSPLTYGAFASPPSFLISMVWAATSAAVAVCASRSRIPGPPWLLACTRACGDASSLAIAALSLAVMLGGWSTGASAPQEVGWAQALYFQVRFTAVFFVFGLARRYVPSPPAQAVSFWAWKALVPMASLSLVLLPVWWAEIWPTWVRAGTKGFLLGVGCVLVLGLPLSALLLRRVAHTTGRRTGLNPWL